MKLSYKWILIITAVLVVAIAAVGVTMAQTPSTITLNAQNNSGETGTATLTDLGDGTTRVDVTVSGEPAGASQPMHIHTGTCDNLNPAPAFPLQNLENGKSSTVITTTMQTLLASPYALNGHKSAEELTVYVFCGDISATAAQGTTTATGEATTAGTEAATTAATTQATTAATTAATTEATTAATTAATTEASATTTETTTVAGAATTTETTVAGATTTETTVASATTTDTTTPAASDTTTPSPTLPTTGADSPLGGLGPVILIGLFCWCWVWACMCAV